MLAYAIEQPAHGQVRVSNELRKRGTFISPSGVRSIWLRHSIANFKQRLVALEKHVAATGAVLTESQVVALEKKRDDDIACDEIETAHLPADLRGYLLQSGLCQAVLDQNADHLGRPSQ